jgi:hypothetical protein
MRGGWGERAAEVDDGFQLSVPLHGADPAFKFQEGTPIFDCIRQIAAKTGKWSYVDNLGKFHYVRQSKDYGEEWKTYKEVPTVDAYDEWLTLEGVKNSSDTRNAIMVAGLSPYTENVAPTLYYAIRKPDYENPALGTIDGPDFLPWLDWVLYQDARLNSQDAVNAMADRLESNNNRVRQTINGRVWGDPGIIPWNRIKLDLVTDEIGLPKKDAEWRMLSTTHVFSENGSYFCDIEAEYIDPKYKYVFWWDE